ncbi:MAG: dTDP-4-dehydrorhamnose reductase [Burkholderiales bacterium]
MKILLTGKTGQVGFHLARTLSAVGTVRATGRNEVDLSDPDAICRTVRELRPDVIVNAAGITAVDNAESNPEPVHTVNAIAPGVFAEEAKRSGALLVHYSSVYVFDGTKRTAYTEADRPNPINEYGRSKLAGENAITAVGGDYLILRASWVYDVRGRNFLLTMLKLAAERDLLQVVDDQVGSPTWARAIAEATTALLGDLARAREAAGLYNLSSVGGVNRYDFTQRLLELNRGANDAHNPRLVRIRTADFPLPAARPLNSMLDTAKLSSTFEVDLTGWEHQLRACLAELERKP